MNQEELLKDVEIVEPPIQEFKKKGHWFATACLSGSGCVLLFIAAIVVGFKLFIGVGPKTIKDLPENFPTEIPIYDEYNMDKIIYVTGRYKSRSMQVASFIPKVVLSPMIYTEQSASSTAGEEQHVIKEFFTLLLQPVSDSRDMIQVEWRDIASDTGTMIEYYRRNLKKEGFEIDSETQGDTYQQITFRREDNLSGSVYAEFADESEKITYAFLNVNLPFAAEVSTSSTSDSTASSTLTSTTTDNEVR